MPSVLIADDEPDIRFLIRRMVEQAGWQVTGEAGTGDEAVALWRSTRPDVIVLDERMPGLTGLEAAALIRAEDPRQPIVLCTAHLATMASAEGVDAHLPKSQLHRLPEELDALVSRGRGDTTPPVS